MTFAPALLWITKKPPHIDTGLANIRLAKNDETRYSLIRMPDRKMSHPSLPDYCTTGPLSTHIELTDILLQGPNHDGSLYSPSPERHFVILLS